LKMMQDPTGPDSAPLFWTAILRVKCRDVPRLMREGFFWSTGNVQPEEGYMSYSTEPRWSALGLNYARLWGLVDTLNGETPLWVAQLEVFTHSLETLSDFRVQNLSRDNVYTGHSWNADRQVVYAFEYHQPSQCYNCIYDDMPLQGW
jgi:hypothetical protein